MNDDNQYHQEQQESDINDELLVNHHQIELENNNQPQITSKCDAYMLRSSIIDEDFNINNNSSNKLKEELNNNNNILSSESAVINDAAVKDEEIKSIINNPNSTITKKPKSSILQPKNDLRNSKNTHQYNLYINANKLVYDDGLQKAITDKNNKFLPFVKTSNADGNLLVNDDVDKLSLASSLSTFTSSSSSSSSSSDDDDDINSNCNARSSSSSSINYSNEEIYDEQEHENIDVVSNQTLIGSFSQKNSQKLLSSPVTHYKALKKNKIKKNKKKKQKMKKRNFSISTSIDTAVKSDYTDESIKTVVDCLKDFHVETSKDPSSMLLNTLKNYTLGTKDELKCMLCCLDSIDLTGFIENHSRAAEFEKMQSSLRLSGDRLLQQQLFCNQETLDRIAKRISAFDPFCDVYCQQFYPNCEENNNNNNKNVRANCEQSQLLTFSKEVKQQPQFKGINLPPPPPPQPPASKQQQKMKISNEQTKSSLKHQNRQNLKVTCKQKEPSSAVALAELTRPTFNYFKSQLVSSQNKSNNNNNNAECLFDARNINSNQTMTNLIPINSLNSVNTISIQHHNQHQHIQQPMLHLLEQQLVKQPDIQAQSSQATTTTTTNNKFDNLVGCLKNFDFENAYEAKLNKAKTIINFQTLNSNLNKTKNSSVEYGYKNTKNSTTTVKELGNNVPPLKCISSDLLKYKPIPLCRDKNGNLLFNLDINKNCSQKTHLFSKHIISNSSLKLTKK